MSKPISDYGFIGNLVTGALVARDGSIDWLCLPRFDSDACFAALLGSDEHGHWRIAPANGTAVISRRYLPETLVIETIFEAKEGKVALIDFMPPDADERNSSVIRIVRGLKGKLSMKMELILRLGYGRVVPWVRRRDYGLRAVAGPDCVDLITPVDLRGENMTTRAEFAAGEGQSIPFTFVYHSSNGDARFVDDRNVLLQETVEWWRKWSGRGITPPCQNKRWVDALTRSKITLKALTFQPAGSIVAAATTSLPEHMGGTRNWDYRFCWIRDATLTLYSLLNSGYIEEAEAFRLWLLSAAAGHPEQLQSLYGVAGERRLTEIELPWLPGYEGSSPVRIGNAAHDQLQLDVYGELMDTLYVAKQFKLGPLEAAWRLQKVLLEHLERIWLKPDAGIWETRGDLHHFTYSKIMAWAAMDRGIKMAEEAGLDGPIDRWKRVRHDIKSSVLANGYDESRNTFVRQYGGKSVDAALLLIAQLGFLPADDPRFRGTVEAVERELLEDGFVRRYSREEKEDASRRAEGTFLPCTFWLADAYCMLDRKDEAAEIFDRAVSVSNDLGLLSEQYDAVAKRLLGNFPQAFSHVGLVNTAHNLLRAQGPAKQRAQ